MKAKLLFQWLTRSLLVIVIMGSFLVIPNQAASAKPLSAVFTNCASQIEIPQTECDALVALYNATDGENWTDNTGWLTTDTPCSWDGVGCSSGTNVTNLSLGWNYLSGTIPPELGNLTNLTQLFLDGNQLSGSIPTELGNLTKLTYLDLSSNDQLNGSIPTELGNLTKLTQLFLDGNQLSGAIPPELGSLTNLISLYLSDNQLSGSIPVELGSLIQLQSLYLRGNQISGEFPASITNLTNLQSFEFDQCAGLTSSNPAVIAFLNQIGLSVTRTCRSN